MNRVLLAISEYYTEPVLTTGVVSVSEHNTTNITSQTFTNKGL